MFDKLRKSMVDAVQEGQLKLGYRSETIRLYYPLASLCALTGGEKSAAEMRGALEEFAKENEPELGKIEVSHRGERFCLAVPPQGARWVHEHTDPNGFLADFIHAIGRHGCTMEELLAMNPNKVYSRENLLNLIWGYDYPGDARTVDVHIRRLREKIEQNPSEPKYVHTKWGVGYYFQG